MAKLSIKAGSVSQSVTLFVQDSSKTNGSGLAGVSSASTGFVGYYTFSGVSTAPVVITPAGLATVSSAYSSGGWITVSDASPTMGLYRFDVPNAMLAAASGRVVTCILAGATNMAPVALEIELTAVDNQATTYGLTGNISASVGGVIGTVTGGMTGTVTGTVGGVVGTVTGGIVGTVTGSVASVVGSVGGVAGTVTGNMTGSVLGTVAGVIGTVTGGLTGTVTGTVGGVIGTVTGSMTGSVGSVTGNVAGSVNSVNAGVTVSTNADKTGYTLVQAFPTNFASMAISVSGLVSDSTFTTPQLESYAANGATASPVQLLYMTWARIAQMSITGTTLTALKLDGVTTSMTFTLNSATVPTAATRAT